MTNGSSREWLEVWGFFLRVHARLVHRLESEMEADDGLLMSWFDVLMQLSFAPEGRLRMHDLLPSLMLTRSGLTRRIDRMEEAGLVLRTGCADDARGVVVELTPKGRARLQEVGPHHAARIRQYFVRILTDDELAALDSAFRRILVALDGTT